MDLTNVSHYRILEKLGQGGMGEVYLAEDTRLGRRVAVKILPASYQYDHDRSARFLKEARAASVLRSPNIAAIFDVGEQDGARYIVMEYVEGEALSERIRRGSLPYREVVELAIQISEALDEAHRSGIIHRDVKSANLMVDARKRIKVLDFGIAKLTSDPGLNEDPASFHQTAQGIVLGTVSYMSPEQALGRKIDHRTDIFSLGVVIYEMLSGQLPFQGSSNTEIIDRILHEEPVPLARLASGIPDEMERIVRRCIEKNIAERYQSTRDLATDLRAFRSLCDSASVTLADDSRTRAIKPTRAKKGIDSLAILPLTNVEADPEAEYLCEGIAESMIINLSQLPKLRVMARSTVFKYKGQDVDPREVGRELNVRAVLVGRLIQRGENLTIKAELVDASDGSRLWADNYVKRVSDIFTVEEEISREISEKLRLKLSGKQKKRLIRPRTESSEAYQLYLKGRYHWNLRTEESLRKGAEYFQRAIEADPNYALAYVGLADTYNILASYSLLSPKDAFPKARAAAERALEIDENLAEALTSLAYIRMAFDWDWRRADKQFARAIELNPGYAPARVWRAANLAMMGMAEESVAEIRRARDVDPLSLPVNAGLAWLLHLARRHEEAVDQAHKTLELDSNFSAAHRRLGQALEQLGKYTEALAAFRTAGTLAGGDPESLAGLGHVHAVMGNTEEAMAVLRRLDEIAAPPRYVPAYLSALVYAGLKDADRCIEWLEEAFNERHGMLAFLNIEPVYDTVRSDPRFLDLVKRVGLPDPAEESQEQ